MAIKASSKRKKKKANEPNYRLDIDRFFEKCRVEYKIYAFQNESKMKMEFLQSIKLPYVVSIQPKRDYFLDGSNIELVEAGFIIAFSNITKKEYLTIRKALLDYFKKDFRINWPQYELKGMQDDEKLSGNFKLTNLKNIKEEISND